MRRTFTYFLCLSGKFFFVSHSSWYYIEFITLHCIALHCIELHCIALHCIVLRCISRCDGISRSAIIFVLKSSQVKSYHITSHHITSHHITSHHITSHHNRQYRDPHQHIHPPTSSLCLSNCFVTPNHPLKAALSSLASVTVCFCSIRLSSTD